VCVYFTHFHSESSKALESRTINDNASELAKRLISTFQTHGAKPNRTASRQPHEIRAKPKTLQAKQPFRLKSLPNGLTNLSVNRLKKVSCHSNLGKTVCVVDRPYELDTDHATSARDRDGHAHTHRGQRRPLTISRSRRGIGVQLRCTTSSGLTRAGLVSRKIWEPRRCGLRGSPTRENRSMRRLRACKNIGVGCPERLR
jgi:hypothetical protein